MDSFISLIRMAFNLPSARNRGPEIGIRPRFNDGLSPISPVSVPTDLNEKTLTKQAKEFNSSQSDCWTLRARSGE